MNPVFHKYSTWTTNFIVIHQSQNAVLYTTCIGLYYCKCNCFTNDKYRHYNNNRKAIVCFSHWLNNNWNYAITYLPYRRKKLSFMALLSSKPSVAPFTRGLTLIPVWISNHMLKNGWNGISYPFPNFSGSAIEVWESISNFIPHIIMDVITYPYWN